MDATPAKVRGVGIGAMGLHALVAGVVRLHDGCGVARAAPGAMALHALVAGLLDSTDDSKPVLSAPLIA